MDEMHSERPLEAIEVLSVVRSHGRQSFLVAFAFAAVVGATAVTYFWSQPTRRASILEFRPTFFGVSQGKYPNGLPFSARDISDLSIIDQVYDGNGLQDYCDRDTFRGGFLVEQRSNESGFLDAEYQARLDDLRLTSVERQALVAEYEAKRAALPLRFRLVFVAPLPCVAMPEVVVAKALTDVLSTWANESEAKRGVLNHQIQVLTPAMLDVGLGVEGSRLLRADLLRTALLGLSTTSTRYRGSRVPRWCGMAQID